MIKILLACGCGASSGFIAQSMRKAAKKEGVEAYIRAVSDTEVPNAIAEYDVLLIGPHIAYRLPDFQKKYTDKMIAVIDSAQYASLDGASVLQETLQKLMKREGTAI